MGWTADEYIAEKGFENTLNFVSEFGRFVEDEEIGETVDCDDSNCPSLSGFEVD